MIRSIRTTLIIALLAIVPPAALAPAAFAQDGAKPVILPGALDALRMPPVEDPDAFVSRHLQQYRADLELFEALLEAEGGVAPKIVDADALLKAGEKNMPPIVILDGSVIDDALFGPPAPFDLPKNAIFIDSIRIGVTPGRLHRDKIYAADAATAAAFGIPNVAGITASGTATFVFNNKKQDGCCAATRRDKKNRIICVRKHRVPTFERREGIDLRGLMGSKIRFGNNLEVLNGGLGGVRFSKPGTFKLQALVDTGRKDKDTVSCQPGGAKQGVTFVPQTTRRAEVTVRVIRYEAFGIPGLDADFTQNGQLSGRDVFAPARKDRRFKPGEASANLARIQRPQARYIDETGQTRTRNIAATVREVNAGPFERTPDGRFRLQRNFRPGQSKFRWRLPGGLEERTHSFNANHYDVELDPDILEKRPVEGREYFAKVIIDGPTELNGYTVEWGGNVQWTQGSVPFKRAGKQSVAINTFTASASNQFPDMTVKMTGPDGEVFSFGRGIATPVEDVQGVEMFAGKGLFGEPNDRKTELDFFFPTADPREAMLARFGPQINTPNGIYDIFEPDPQLFVVQAHQAAADKVIVVDNPGVIVGGGKVNIRPGFAEFQVKPAINEARVVAIVGGPTIDPRNELSLPGGKVLATKPVNLTVNSVRLVRRGGGFDLVIRGAADMSKYRARWKRRRLSAQETRFTAEDDGAVARFNTNERLTKVEIIEGGDVHATILGVQATIPANIALLPFNSPISEIEQASLQDFANDESLSDCIGTINFGINFMEFDTGGRSARDFCKAERKDEKSEVRADRDAGKQRNRLIRDFERQGKQLIALNDAMDVGALISGLPSGNVGKLLCVWKVIGGGNGLKPAARTTAVTRTGDQQGACVNQVLNIRQGFAPGAKLEVALMLDDRAPAVAVVTNEANPAFEFEEKE